MKRFSIVMLLLSVFIFVACGDDDSDGTKDSGNGKCTDSNKFCNSHEGLNWSDRSASGMNWDDAVAYCDGMGGRLPTISELRTIIKNCPDTETDGNCGVTDSCFSSGCWLEENCIGCTMDVSGKYSVFGDYTTLWSSSSHDETNDSAWSVTFIDSRIVNLIKTFDNDVRCVQ